MQNRRANLYALILILDVLLFGFAMMGIFRMASRLALPAAISESHDTLLISGHRTGVDDSPFAQGDTIISVNGYRVDSYRQINFIVDHQLPGDMIPVEVGRPGSRQIFTVELGRYYTTLNLFAHIITALIYFALGILIYTMRRTEEAAFVFHWIIVLIAIKILSSWASYRIFPPLINNSLQIMDFAGNAFMITLAVHFSFIFPRHKVHTGATFLTIVYLPSAILFGWMTVTFPQSLNPMDLEAFRRFEIPYTFTRWMLSGLLLIVVGNLVHSYISARERQERQKLLWVLLGTLLAPGVYACLWTIPYLIIGRPLINTNVMLLMQTALPITFSIAIIRHKLFDIVLLFNRSTVIAVLFGLLLGVYALIVGVVSALVQSFTDQTSYLASGLAAAVVVLIFEPTHRLVQRYVEQYLFKSRHRMRLAQRELVDELLTCFNTTRVAEIVLDKLDYLLEPERQAIFVSRIGASQLGLVAHSNFESLKYDRLPIDINADMPRTSAVLADVRHIETDVPIDSVWQNVLRQMTVAIAIPMLNEADTAIGLLFVGPLSSGGRYDQNEIDFITLAAGLATQTIERINLQQSLVLEQAETRRLEELSEMKSYFVSSVSHDLKSPLTSIQIFAEMMHTGTVKSDKVQEYSAIIQAETGRLNRMIENVLDFSRIEKGIKEYSFDELDLNRLVSRIMDLMEYQFKLREFEVKIALAEGELIINGDADALMDAANNLLNNTLKYSGKDRHVEVRTFKSDNQICLQIADRGVGIPAELQQHIFDPFYRVAAESTIKAAGTGLGLSVVKHIMDAHHGRIELISEPGNGSTFTLYFPIQEQ